MEPITPEYTRLREAITERPERRRPGRVMGAEMHGVWRALMTC